MNPSNNQKVAIVTGASRGIGREIAEHLGRLNLTVVVGYEGPDERANADAVVSAIEQAGGRALAVAVNVTKVAEIENLFSQTERQVGRPDVAVFNAGVSTLVPLVEMTEAEYYRVFDVNAKGTLFCLKEAAKTLNDNGRIVIISSSTTAFPLEGAAIYAGSKAPLKLYAEIGARELGTRGITVNAIMPGITISPMTERLPNDMKEQVASTSPFGRLGQPADIAGAVATLVSEDAHWITGQTILVNGAAKQ